MFSFSLFLQTVHENVHGLNMKLNFSAPKIYTGGLAILQWSNYSKQEQNDALKKDWYIYYSFRDPKTNLLKSIDSIK